MIYLASSSPRRRKLLRGAGIRFRPAKSSYAEKIAPDDSPRLLVRRHAWGKAISTAVKTGAVLGADTVVFFRGKTIGKPENLKDARRILRMLQGRPHAVWTGVALVWLEKGRVVRKKIFAEKTIVKIRPMSDAQIRSYFRRVDPLDKAGAYAIQSRPGIVESIRGSRTNAIGLPLERLRAILSD